MTISYLLQVFIVKKAGVLLSLFLIAITRSMVALPACDVFLNDPGYSDRKEYIYSWNLPDTGKNSYHAGFSYSRNS
ncbi:hypothetical protein ACFLWW_00690 [Chloroflexota bacterium]